MKVLPVGRYRWGGTNFTVAPLLLMEQFSHNRLLGGKPWSSGFWGAGPVVGVKLPMFLLQQTYKQLVTLSGRNETSHWTEGVELKEFLYCGLPQFYWLEGRTRHLNVYRKFHMNSLTHMNWCKTTWEGCEDVNMIQTKFSVTQCQKSVFLLVVNILTTRQAEKPVSSVSDILSWKAFIHSDVHK